MRQQHYFRASSSVLCVDLSIETSNYDIFVSFLNFTTMFTLTIPPRRFSLLRFHLVASFTTTYSSLVSHVNASRILESLIQKAVDRFLLIYYTRYGGYIRIIMIDVICMNIR